MLGRVDVAAFVVSLIALLTAGFSLWLTWGRDERDKLRFAREERQLTREEERAEAARRANVSVKSAGGHGGPTATDRQFLYTAHNNGPAAARRVRLWLADSDGAPVSAEADVDGLQPGERSEKRPLTFHGPTHVGKELQVMVAWEDEDGQHEIVGHTMPA